MSDIVNITFFIVALVSFIFAAVAALSLWKREKDMPSYEEVEKNKMLAEYYRKEFELYQGKYEQAKELADKLEFLKIDWANKADMALEIEALKKQLIDLTTKITDLEEQEKKLEGILKNLEELRESLKIQIQELTIKKAILEKEIEVLEGKKTELIKSILILEEELNALKGRKDELVNEISYLTERRNSLNIDIQILRVELERMRNELDEFIEKDKDKRKEMSDSFDKFKKVDEGNRNSLNTSLQDIRKSHNEIIEENARLTGESKGLKDLIEQQKGVLEKLNAQLPTKELTKEEAAKSLESLWTPIQLNAYHKGSFAENENEIAMIAKVHQKLDEEKILYHERVIKSFHTNLKINEITPLTVLAGISGTGKSLLPLIYCEAMGINFLSLAVQPRWDSPQDLFGFYNYMEKRYVATDLARAMVEFEQYNFNILSNYGAKCAGRRKDQMLLILFDEMNLARIEYYFSEFLSKLETRRVTDIGDPEKRQKAQLKIESGLQQDIFLFPSNNLLFVGTMNEDESTQSLSDKVMDRASILRFGKPTNLATQEKIVQDRPQEYYLPHKKWLKWFNPEEPSIEICNKIENLNQIMNALGRPFGHRVGKAIKQYISNYPQGDNHINLALADQIEQRIIPKLRGLSVSENKNEFEAIGNILTKCDKELADQFRTCLKNAQERGFGTFNWLGFDRTSAK